MSLRSRPFSALPKAPTTVASSAIIAETAILTGTHRIIIGSDVVLHPRARLTSTYCPITVRTGCIISERTNVGPSEALTVHSSRDETGYEVELGTNVVLEPGVVCEARSVGEGSVLEAGCKVGVGAVIGKYCKITSLCVVKPGEVLEDFTIVYGDNQKRKEKPGLEALRMKTHEKEIEVLRKLIPSNLTRFQST